MLTVAGKVVKPFSWPVVSTGHFLLMLFAAFSGTVNAAVYDLSSNWSNSSNPNGPWSYNQGSTRLPFVSNFNFANTVQPLSCNQPAWAPSNAPGSFLPVFLQLNACTAAYLNTEDALAKTAAGDVAVHTVDGFNGNPSLGPANILFTLPASGGAGAYTITGSLWDTLPGSATSASRPQDWSLLLNGVQIAAGVLSGSVSRSQAQTFSLVENLSVGDHVELQIVKDPAASAGFIVSINLTISAQSSASPLCQLGLTPSSAAAGVNGGTGNFNIGLSNSSCPWTAISNAPWIHIPGASTGTGNGTLNYSVDSNASSSLSRAGTITVSSANSQAVFTVTEAGAVCTFALTQASQAFSSAGGTGTATVVAPGGCTWTASSAGAPFVTITSGSTGSGDGTVSFTVAANPSSTARTGTLTIAGQSYTVTQAGTAVTTACTASVPSVPTVALEGRTEVVGDLVLACTGLTGPLTSDILLTLSTNVSNALISSSATDAILTVNGGNPLNGQVSASTTLRWVGVTLTPTGGTASVRITGVRADASLLGMPASLQASAITGLVSFNGLTPVPVTGSQQTVANAAVSFNFLKQQASPPTGGAQTTIPLVYQEARAGAFHAASGATAATRLRMVLTNVPPTVQVYAPVFPNEGATLAQLFSADATGFGGAAVTGSAMGGVAYQLLTVTGGTATATWVVLAADTGQPESLTFPLLVTGATSTDLTTIQVAASLGPVSAVSASSAAVGVAYSVLLVNPISGVPPYTWSVVSGALPNGLSLNMNTGAVSGTPTNPGAFSFSVRVTDSNPSLPQSATQNFTITVAPVPRFRDFSVPQKLVNLRVTSTVQSGGTGSVIIGHSAQVALPAKVAPDRTAAHAIANVGSNVTFTNQVLNDTSDPTQTATNVIVGDKLPSGLNLTSCTATNATCTTSGGQIVVNYATLGPGMSAIVTVTAQVSQQVPNGTVLENPVSALSDQVNADLSASTASSSILVSNCVAGQPAAIAASGGTPQSAPAGSAFANTLQAMVTDSCGNPVSGVTVLFNAPLNGASAVLSSITAVTNGAGVASVTAMANGTAGSYTVTASVGTLSASFALTNAITVCCGGTDLALHQPATQSSTIPGYPTAVAASAVDGSTDGVFFDGSVTATNLDTNAWWEVDLGAPGTLNSVVIWNRTDCCGSRLSDYWVFVSNTPFGPTDTPATLQNRAATFASHQTTAPSPSTTIALAMQGRYVRVQLSDTDYLSLAEVQVFGSGTTSTNLALDKPATQSSTYPSAFTGAMSADDGNTDGNFADGSLSVTNADPNAWWQVDLGTSATINSIVIWNRTDCCGSRLSDYWVFVSNTPFQASDTPANLQNRAGTFSSHQTTAPNPSATIAAATQGRYVRVQLTNTDYLTLAEVQLFGPGSTAPPPTDLAQGQSASQSSTFPGFASAAAGSAVDGRTDGAFGDGSVTATNSDSSAWWQVDLGSSASVSSVVVWNRTDCCSSRLSDYWVFVSSTPFLATDTPATLQSRAGTFSSHQTSAPNPSTSIVVGAQGRYVRVQLTSTGYLSLAEVQVFGTGGAASSNLAPGKAATQSSTLPGTPPAGVAVDGNTDGAFSDGSVTATNLDMNAWWQVDLGSPANVGSVAIWNRTDCCASRLGDYWVFVSNTPFLATDTPATLQNRAGTFSSHQTSAPNPSTAIAVGTQGRYVRVQLTGANYLSLAEVQVFGQ